MAHSKRVEDWDRVAQLSLFISAPYTHRSKKLRVEDFHPWRSRGESMDIRSIQEAMKNMPERYAETGDELWEQFDRLDGIMQGAADGGRLCGEQSELA